MPQTPLWLSSYIVKQRYHYHSGFRPFCQSKVMSGCRSCFSFIYYDSSFYLHLLIVLQTIISSRSSITLHHFSARYPTRSNPCPECFVSIKIYKAEGNIPSAQPISPYAIHFSRYNRQHCQLAKSHPKNSYDLW